MVYLDVLHGDLKYGLVLYVGKVPVESGNLADGAKEFQYVQADRRCAHDLAELLEHTRQIGHEIVGQLVRGDGQGSDARFGCAPMNA